MLGSRSRRLYARNVNAVLPSATRRKISTRDAGDARSRVAQFRFERTCSFDSKLRARDVAETFAVLAPCARANRYSSWVRPSKKSVTELSEHALDAAFNAWSQV